MPLFIIEGFFQHDSHALNQSLNVQQQEQQYNYFLPWDFLVQAALKSITNMITLVLSSRSGVKEDFGKRL